MESGHAPGAQRAEQLVPERVHGKEQRHAEQAQAVHQGVDDVDPDGAPVGHGFDRPPALQRHDHQQHRRQLDQAHQQPARGVVAVFQQLAQARAKHQRLHHGLEQPLLRRIKYVHQSVHHLPYCKLQRDCAVQRW
ncbi:hypothetical protein D3C78_1365950 [compost metagenome]